MKRYIKSNLDIPRNDVYIGRVRSTMTGDEILFISEFPELATESVDRFEQIVNSDGAWSDSNMSIWDEFDTWLYNNDVLSLYSVNNDYRYLPNSNLIVDFVSDTIYDTSNIVSEFIERF